MESYPKTAVDFEEWFQTEEACLDFLFQLRWPEGFRCPRCGGSNSWPMKRGTWECGGCGVQTSVTAGTIFHDSRKPIRLWFRAIWYVVNQKNGVSALGLQRVLGLGSYHTAWTWLHKLRVAMVRPGREQLGGTVEVDETYLGGERKGKRGRGALGKTLVLVAVEDKGDHLGRIRLCQIPDASASSLVPAVKRCIDSGSTVRTDGWKGYVSLNREGFLHTAIHKENTAGDNLLPLANRVISLLKRWLQGTHQGAVCQSHLEYYLDEFTFRFNRRTCRSRGMLFYRLVQQAVVVSPVKGKDLLGGSHKI